MGTFKGNVYYSEPGETPPRIAELKRQIGARSARVIGPHSTMSPYFVPPPGQGAPISSGLPPEIRRIV